MVENVRAYYMQRANDWEEENQDDGSNAKYGAFVLLKNTTWDKVKYKKLLIYFPIYQIYFSIYGLLLPLTFLAGSRISWKDRKL